MHGNGSSHPTGNGSELYDTPLFTAVFFKDRIIMVFPEIGLTILPF